MQYEISLPYRDKYFYADTQEKAYAMAQDLSKDFYAVAIAKIENNGKTYCVIETLYNPSASTLQS